MSQHLIIDFLRAYDQMPRVGMVILLEALAQPDHDIACDQVWCILWCEAQGYA